MFVLTGRVNVLSKTSFGPFSAVCQEFAQSTAAQCKRSCLGVEGCWLTVNLIVDKSSKSLLFPDIQHFQQMTCFLKLFLPLALPAQLHMYFSLKAFDSLPHSLLVRKLQAYGVDEQSCLLLQNYLQGRLQRVKVGDAVSSWDFNRRGVPQGSVLGPLLFNVFLNDLSYFITRVKLNAYADDQQLYSSDSDHVALYNKLIDELCIAVDWFKHNGLMA